MKNRFLMITNKLNDPANRFMPVHRDNGMARTQSKKARCTQYSEIEIEDDAFVLDILQFFFDERLEASDLNDDLREIAARALWKATDGSEAMDMVPRPPGDRPGPVWLVSQSVQIAFRRAQNRCIYEAVRRTIKLSMRSEYEIAKQLGTPSSTMQSNLFTSDRGVTMIKAFKRFRANLYNNQAGHCTIGYSHLVHRGACNGSEPEEFRAGISEARATELLRQRLVSFENTINQKVTVALNQHQFDALVSFAFNVGAQNFGTSALLKELNQGHYDAVPEQLKRWKYATVNGEKKVLPSLVLRREKEAALFKDGKYPDTATAQSLSALRLDLAEAEAPYAREFKASIDWCQIRHNIIRSAVEIQGDWLTTGSNLMDESNSDALDMLIMFWRDGVGMSQANAEASAALSAADERAWSAAFISWCVRNAQPSPPPPHDGGFHFSQRHMAYIGNALRNRENNDQTRPFWLYDINEPDIVPEEGDILCLNRQVRQSDGTYAWTRHSYQSVRQQWFVNHPNVAAPTGHSHCDIVIGQFKENGRQWIETIGGNVGNTVGSTYYSLDANGRLVDSITLSGNPKPNRNNVTQAVGSRPAIVFGLIRLTACNNS